MNLAAKNGHLDVVKWLHEHRTEGCTTVAMNYAAYKGHLHVVKWLHKNRTEGCTTYAMDLATSNGHLHIVKWLHENRTEGCTAEAMNIATRKGHLEILQYLYSNYKHLVTKVNQQTYQKILPFIQEDFRKIFEKIQKENIVREFITKKLVYHPTSCYMKRIVNNF
jgi:hypothetical protein